MEDFDPAAERIRRMLNDWRDRYLLTEAEADVLEHLLDGLSNKEIAHRRGTRMATARTQIASLLAKTKIDSRVGLVCKLLREVVAGEEEGARVS